MSRIGKQPIKLPEGVTLEVSGQTVKVSGPKGTLERELARGLKVKIDKDLVIVSPKKTDRKHKALHGTFRALIANMVKGVSEGWSKELELVGIGYKVETSGKDIILNVGFSHPVKIEAQEGIIFETEKTQITIKGIDKELVGKVAAEIRRVRPPEPYKGKGIRYKDEIVRRKPGKAAKAQEGAGVA